MSIQLAKRVLRTTTDRLEVVDIYQDGPIVTVRYSDGGRKKFYQHIYNNQLVIHSFEPFYSIVTDKGFVTNYRIDENRHRQDRLKVCVAERSAAVVSMWLTGFIRLNHRFVGHEPFGWVNRHKVSSFVDRIQWGTNWRNLYQCIAAGIM